MITYEPTLEASRQWCPPRRCTDARRSDTPAPCQPTRLGSYSFPEEIWGFRVVGSLVYVAADFFGLGILDVSNAAAPALRGSIKTPGQAKGVAFAVDAPTGLYVFDMSKPESLDAVTVQQSATAPGSIVVSNPADAGSPTVAAQ